MAHPAMEVPVPGTQFSRMSRALRPNLPGVPFHLTARVQWQQPLFEGLQQPIAGWIRKSVAAARARLVAYVVMSNHLHIVVVQGKRPLGDIMHPLLRRSALLVQRRHGLEGHVFERRFRHRVCLTPQYFRNAVTYVHLNPLRAGLCSDPAAYEWSSHAAYCRAAGHGHAHRLPSDSDVAMQAALRTFATQRTHGTEQCQADYLRFLRWRMDMDRFLAAGGRADNPAAPIRPCCTAGDEHWIQEFGSAANTLTPQYRDSTAKNGGQPDLKSIAERVLREIATYMPLDLLRSGRRMRPLVQVRRAVIIECAAAGYTNGQIARFLRIAPCTVSQTVVAARSRDEA
jgi:REP element-mobilizing transposase RayT